MSATDTLRFVVVFIATHHRPLSSPSLSVMMSPQLIVGCWLTLLNGHKWCFSDGFSHVKDLPSGIPKCLTWIAYYRNVRLTEVAKYEEKMVAEVVYLLGAPCRVT